MPQGNFIIRRLMRPLRQPKGSVRRDRGNEGKKPDGGLTMDTAIVQRRKQGSLSREAQQKISQQLRAMYENVVKEGIPERFAKMLRQSDEEKDKDTK